MNEINLVQDRKTGVWYDPQAKWEELRQEPWFLAQLQRMHEQSFDAGVAAAFTHADQE